MLLALVAPIWGLLHYLKGTRILVIAFGNVSDLLTEIRVLLRLLWSSLAILILPMQKKLVAVPLVSTYSLFRLSYL